VNENVIATIIARNEAETEIISIPFGCACDHDGDLATLSFAGGMKYGSSTSKLNSRPTAFFAVNVIIRRSSVLCVMLKDRNTSNGPSDDARSTSNALARLILAVTSAA
jgi:hypothetical protein